MSARTPRPRATILLALLVVGCGYKSVDNEVVGQPKKLVRQTPIICPSRVDLDLSLGVMRHGVGSMSTRDEWFTIPDADDQKTLRQAVEAGKIVRLKYDVLRVAWCWEDHVVRSVEILGE